MCFDYEIPEKADQKKTLEKINEKKLQQPELERAEEKPITAWSLTLLYFFYIRKYEIPLTEMMLLHR